MIAGDPCFSFQTFSWLVIGYFVSLSAFVVFRCWRPFSARLEQCSPGRFSNGTDVSRCAGLCRVAEPGKKEIWDHSIVVVEIIINGIFCSWLFMTTAIKRESHVTRVFSLWALPAKIPIINTSLLKMLALLY